MFIRRKFRIFEKITLLQNYIDTTLSLEELIHHYSEKNSSDTIKNNGIVYTPLYICDYMVASLKPTLNDTVFESSFGHGMFIFSLLNYIEKTFKLSPLHLKKYFLNKVFGMDLQEKNIEEFSTCSSGNVDLFYAFIEFAYTYSKKCSFITPNSWLYTQSSLKIRQILKPYLIELIDFKEERIFNAATYVSIFHMDKTQVSSTLMYKTHLNTPPILQEKSELDDTQWVFNKNNQNNYDFKSLSFKTPIATLKDNVYLSSFLNNEDTVAYFKVSKLKSKEELLKSDKKILFPYKNINNKYVIKNEEELDSKTLNYLRENQSLLEQRDKGKTHNYEKWFAYGRKQGLNIYNYKNDIVIIPGMISTTYTFFNVSLENIPYPFVFSSGFIIEVSKNEVDTLLNVLNGETFKEYLKNYGKIWKGKDKEHSYYSLTIKQLKKILG